MDSYISCIKIRGMPILPPIMTDDIRAEMNYYKQLAVAVEDKLINCREADQNLTAYPSSSVETENRIDNEALGTDSRDLPQDEPLMVDNSRKKEYFCNKSNSESVEESSKAISDDESPSKSTDINRYMNTSDSSKTDITEISEIVKPQVPKTLDIVPITLDPMMNSNNCKATLDDSGEETPKLVRQGSYTLETPSPMLLAHLEHTKDDYVPTPTVNGNKRTEWKIGQPQYAFAYQNYSKGGNRPEARRTSISESGSCRRNKYYSPKKTGCQVARSVDCIQLMLSKEPFNNHKNIRSIERSQSSSGFKSPKQHHVHINQNAGHNLANKLGGSLSALSNKSSPTNAHKCHKDQNRMTKSFEVTIENELKPSPKRCKPVLTSDKLLYVFNEIQKTHEQQMTDLIARQQREQAIMQQEFEKQQLMLLSQIGKSFPGVSVELLAQKLHETSMDNARGQRDLKNSISLPKFTHESRNSTSPINGSSMDSEESISMSFNEIKTNDSSSQLYGLRRERRKSCVSRELFPLESDATFVPVNNFPIYNQRHIQAAIIINAYARGYLVRRLMKTDRVITLKRTYKEALHCLLKLQADVPLELPELNFHQRLQHQCDAASMSIVDLFAQNPIKRMEIIANDRSIKRARHDRPSSARSSYSFATQRTLARKKFKELGIIQVPDTSRTTCSARMRCQSWTSNTKEKRPTGIIYQGIKRSTSAGAVRKPWR